ILSVAGKQKLATELADGIRAIIAPAPPRATAAASVAEPADASSKTEAAEAAKPAVEVLFTSFIVQ
ncbi:MAG TPA: hypothetical protein VFB75_02955, partial [Burkholderiales bacterium]|nr:hypothetical protein [Burkholderiales bacterium]